MSKISKNLTDLVVSKNSTILFFETLDIYRALSALIVFTVLYLFLNLGYYEGFVSEKPPGGRKLRIVSLCASFAGLLYQIMQQISLALSSSSMMHCVVASMVEVALYLVFISMTYVFFWARQHIFYSNPRLKHLQNKITMISSTVALVMIVLNPIVLVVMQFLFSRYNVENGICLYSDHLSFFHYVFDAVALSYALIHVS